VQWETRKEQAQNRRNTIMISHNGETMTQRDWAKRLGVRDCSIAYRVKHWGADKALSKPFKKRWT
jgi:transposase